MTEPKDDQATDPQIIVAKVEHELDQLPFEAQQEVIETLFLERSVSGPIPSPELLSAYNNVVPGLADRLVVAWEEESAHRREMQRLDQRGSLALLGRGQWFAFILVLLLAAGGVYLADHGHTAAAISLLTTTILSVLAVFVLRQLPSARAHDEPVPDRTDTQPATSKQRAAAQRKRRNKKR